MKKDLEKKFNDYLTEKYQLNINGQMIYIDDLGEIFYKQAPEEYSQELELFRQDYEELMCVMHEDDYKDNEYLYDLRKEN